MPSDSTIRVAFINQGRASTSGVQGHVRADHAVRVGFSERDEIVADFRQLRAWTPLERLARTPVRRLKSLAFTPLRWQLARSRAAREEVAAALDSGSDVVHLTTHAVGFGLGRLTTDIPVVMSVDVPVTEWQRTLRDLPPDAELPVDVRAQRRLERRALSRAAGVIAWTATVADQLRAAHPGLPVDVLHPGLDTEVWRPAPERRAHGPQRVLFVGGRFKAKGGPLLIEALGARLGDDIQLDIVTGDDVPARDGVTVHRLDGADPELVALYQRADVFALPTGADAVPWVVLEAMATGTPVVSTDVGSIPEMLGVHTDRPCGVVTRPGDVTALRNAIGSLLDDPERRELLGRNALHRVADHYDARRQAAHLAELLRLAIQTRVRSTRSTRPPSPPPQLTVLMVLGRMQASGTESLLHLTGPRWSDEGIVADIAGIDPEIGPFAGELGTRGYRIHHTPRLPRLRFVLAYMKLVRQYDVVHVHLEHFNLMLITLARLARRPVIRTHHNVRSFTGAKRRQKKVARWFTRLLGVQQIAVSESVASDELSSLANTSRVIWNCYDSRRFTRPTASEREAARAALGIAPGTFAVVTVGNCNEQKNHGELLNAFAAIETTDKHLFHIGQEQPGRPERRLVDPADVTFVGSIPDVAPYLRAADCFAMPSLWEGLGIAALEALACGVPVVLSDVRGLRDQRHACEHITWTTTDALGIEAGLRTVAETKPTCGCADRVSGLFSPEVFVGEHAAVYRGAVSRGKPHGHDVH